MPITAVDKVKLNKYLRETPIEELSYIDMCNVLGKKTKASDIEFLEYFTDYAINEMNKDGNISMKQLKKVIIATQSFLKWASDEKKEISEEILDKIRNFNNFYDEYLEKNNIQEPDKDFQDNYLKNILKLVNKLYPNKNQSESLTKYINQIKELDSTIKLIKKDLENKSILYDNAELTNKQKDEKIEALTQEIKVFRNELKEKNQSTKELEERISNLNNELINLNNEIDKLQTQNSSLLSIKKQYEELKEQYIKLKKQSDEIKKIEEAKNIQKEKEQKIKEIIYQKLLFEKEDINSLLNYLETQDIKIDKQEVSKLLKQLRRKINIENNSFSLTPEYKIVPPTLIENTKFNIEIPKGKQQYDIMLVSDFHLENFDIKILSGLDALNEYCIKNGINLILNLGDFFNGTPGQPLDYVNAQTNYKIIEHAIHLIPKTDEIYHAILGGNHDRSISKYGFDPLAVLTNERADLIHLGYKHSTINLTQNDKYITSFDIHHPEQFDFPIRIKNNNLNSDELEEYLETIYNLEGRNREDSYIDILGHTHRNQFNFLGSYCYIPAYFDGKNKRGACHMQIHLDEDGYIEGMVFMPLSFNTKLIKNNEIIYQKVLKK